jgi:pseudouridine-5'-phosphate glycosidase
MSTKLERASLGLSYEPEVLEALRSGRPVVALESTIISHGIPKPRNLEVARELEAIVRNGGSCPATVAVLDGIAHIGLTGDQLDRIAMESDFRKLGLRDLPIAMAQKASGATTVSATAFLAARAGARVFATGGLGGVHRGWAESWDESADLDALSQTRITIVSAGIKSILDIPATLQRLETLNVSVVGFRTQVFPGFYLHSSGERVDWVLDSAESVANVMRAQDDLGIESALLVANAVPEKDQLDPLLHDEVLAEALASAEREGIGGQRMTPYLLARMFEGTGGASLEANLAAVRGNVSLAADISVAWSAQHSGHEEA